MHRSTTIYNDKLLERLVFVLFFDFSPDIMPLYQNILFLFYTKQNLYQIWGFIANQYQLAWHDYQFASDIPS